MSTPDDPPPTTPPSAGARGASAAAQTEGPPSRREFVQPPPGEGRVLRFVFHLLWIFAVPFALAVASVWLLTPAPGDVNASGLRVFVADQKIPAGIVLFTLFAMALWRFRHDLPLAASIGVGGRRDVPVAARGRFEDAGALLEEARRILRTRSRDVQRELTLAEREQVTQSLASLDRAMSAERFDQAEFDAGYARADRAVGEHLGRWRKGEMREYAESIGIAVAVALLLRAFVVEAFKIPSGSMIPTLMVNDHIFVNKFTYGPLIPLTDNRLFSHLPPQRSDVMVFKFPENKEQDFIKRAIAVPGDTLEAINGRPIINGWLVPHCYVGQFKYEDRAPEHVPAITTPRTGELYVEYLEDRSYLTLFDSKTDEQTCTGADDCGSGFACRDAVCGILQGPFHVKPEEVWVMGDNRNNSHDSRSWHNGAGGGVPFENIKGRAMFVWMSFGRGNAIDGDRLLVNVIGRPTVPHIPFDPRIPDDQEASRVQEAALKKGVDRCLQERPSVAQTTPPLPGSVPPVANPGRRGL